MRLWNPVGVREFAALARDPVFRGRGIPHGDGRAVLLIPGFLSGDWSMLIMSNWLQRIGYTPHMSGAGLRKRLAAVRAESDGRVSLVGHSRGGVLAKVLSSRMPDAVEQVIGLGSPFANQLDVAALTNVAVGVIRAAGELRYGRRFQAEGRFAHELRQPPAVPTTSIYTKSDEVVNFRSCLRPDIPAISVWGGHNGLVVNHAVRGRRLRAGLIADSR